MSNVSAYFSNSLSRKFSLVMMIFICIFVVGSGSLVGYQRYMINHYADNQEDLRAKRKVVQEIGAAFNEAFFDSRGYIAFDRKDLKENALRQEAVINQLQQKLKPYMKTPKDKEYFNEMNSFRQYYFKDLLLKGFQYHERNERDQLINLSKSGGTKSVVTFQRDWANFTSEINKELENDFLQQVSKQSQMEFAFIIFILIILFAIACIIRLAVNQMGKPLSTLASAAEQLAADEEVGVLLDTNRKDEIGKLSSAFQRMVHTIHEKEQYLIAQNDELLAQQEELQAQQTELEELLDLTEKREQMLNRRNQLINGLSNSLDKQEVLESIVLSMSELLGADRGIVSLFNKERSYASIGVSAEGAKQFLNHLYNGLNEKLFKRKRAYTIKRELAPSEKGFHTEVGYSYDVYIPILSSKDEVEAVMVFNRFSHEFSAAEVAEYEGLGKQIAISLEKITMYERAENDRSTFQSILNNVQEGIQLVNNEGDIITLNTKMTEILTCSSHTKATAWQENLLQLVKDPDGLAHYFAIAFNESDEVYTYQLKEETQVIQVYATPLYNGREKIGTILVHRDITKEYEIDQIKSEFVSTVSHELRTPLSSILGFSELMLSRELKPERQKKYVQTIYQEAQRLTALINDFLDVQRMESGKQTYDKRYGDVMPVIQRVIDLQEINAKDHTFHLQRETDQTIILMDEDKIGQVLTNLISNAVKYSPNGNDITVRVYEQSNKLCVDVIDQGLGIPKDALDKLFTKFYRVDNSDRRRIGGTGLGLSIVKEIVKAHQGEVEVQSTLKEGSTFTVKLPSVQQAEQEIEEEILLPQSAHAHVMIIEDDMSLATLLEAELQDSNFAVKHYKSGREAMGALEEQKPDAIVLDIMLNEKDLTGWDVLTYLKQSSRLKDIPIVVSSALEEKEKGMSLGASSYLVKPYQPSQLSKLILQILLTQEKTGEILIPSEEKSE
ncbi:ATP-binding protein [Priestia koreensis]|uniref:ATP-binding protein n=1 Tax=Priestia koreensis TaxID=284581 RepID=UPI003D01A9E8